jgi:UDP-N-acetylmuramate dehydrogenase
MDILRNESLSKYTTIGIGGTAKNMYFPSNKEDILEIFSNNYTKVYILGGGSNLLINDTKVFEHVISMKKYEKKIEFENTKKVKISASVGLGELIKKINQRNIGGIEYLYTIPGTIGGAVFMNAGRGEKHKQSISDYVESVVAIDIATTKIVTLSKEECNFSYRNSIFKKENHVILEINFNFVECTKELITYNLEQKMDRVKKYQDHSGRNFGSVFRKFNRYLMQIVRIASIKSGNVRFSKKTSNWIINTGDGSYKDVLKLIKKVKFYHKFILSDADLEVIIWD